MPFTVPLADKFFYFKTPSKPRLEKKHFTMLLPYQKSSKKVKRDNEPIRAIGLIKHRCICEKPMGCVKGPEKRVIREVPV